MLLKIASNKENLHTTRNLLHTALENEAKRIETTESELKKDTKEMQGLVKWGAQRKTHSDNQQYEKLNRRQKIAKDKLENQKGFLQLLQKRRNLIEAFYNEYRSSSLNPPVSHTSITEPNTPTANTPPSESQLDSDRDSYIDSDSEIDFDNIKPRERR